MVVPKKRKRLPDWVRRADALRERRGWSLRQLAAVMTEMGNPTDVETLYKIFQGKVAQPRGSTVADIAAALDVTEQFLRYGRASGVEDDPDDITLPRNGILEIDFRAGLGGGGTMEGREVVRDGSYADPIKEEAWQLPARFIREEIRVSEKNLRVVETYGDSMAPTLLSGDRVIVDTGHQIPSPDGIYALRDQFGFLVVKRLQVLRTQPPVVRIISDNTAHAPEDVPIDNLAIVGRVVWAVKRI
ncbi:helix-turn-helix domain-containing protein [Pseudorhodoplanes sp.]|uniref:helix-turn-helix domain-containing protein n=1 Tax=Pseudorhodoplanes sp. TaxID=1934341 RepID=UPI002BCCF58B|nr:S24 family peptidase [Pseudorhodoplanes sp.]HWV44086.1 S24 family peptidase [Pseudorhodoplanes sp.]